MVYRVKTNSNGFRNNENLKNSFLITSYGGSYTFGPYLPNHDTFPSILEFQMRKKNPKKFKDLQVLNAGLAGTTIFHQIELLENTKSINSDLVILQISDRDIYAVSSSFLKSPSPIRINNSSIYKETQTEKEIYKECGLKINN